MDSIQWNLGLERIGNVLHVRMPDGRGNVPQMADGFLIKWPLNPHSTGRSAIVAILQAMADKGEKPLAGALIQ